jgi:predicted MFS family arabinose efflux permease
MTNPYRELLATPGAKSLAAAGFVMRLPIAMQTLGIVLLLVATTGSYALAGAVAATFALVHALAAPFLARLVDRRGQARVMLPALVVHAVGVLGLLLGATVGAPTWAHFVSVAVAAAAHPSVSALVRARWAYFVGGRGLLHTAYSFEAVADEVIFIVGPVAVTLLATQVAPAAGLAMALACACAGTIALAPQRRTEPPPGRPGRDESRSSPVSVPGVWVLTAACVGFGGVFGSVEVVVVAFTQERGQPAAAAVVLALIAAGSMASGIVHGARRLRSRLDQRFRRSTVALGLAVAILPLVGSVPVLAVAAFVAGLAVSPSIISAFGLVEALVPAAVLTEGLTWATTGIGVGIALGSLLGGAAVEAGGAQPAFLVTSCSGLAAAAVVVAAGRWLRAPPRARPWPTAALPVAKEPV